MLADRKRLKLSLSHICPPFHALNVWLESLLKFYIKKKKLNVLNSPFLSVYVWYHAKVFPGGSVGKNPPAVQETWVPSLGWEDPLEEGMATHSSILAWRTPVDRGPRRATVHGVAAKSAP